MRFAGSSVMGRLVVAAFIVVVIATIVVLGLAGGIARAAPQRSTGMRRRRHEATARGP
jgi:hypothetical protein